METEDSDDYANIALTTEGVKNCCKSSLKIADHYKYCIVVLVLAAFVCLFVAEFVLGFLLIELNLELDGEKRLVDIDDPWSDPCYTVPFTSIMFGLFGWSLFGSFLVMGAAMWDKETKSRIIDRKPSSGVEMSRRLFSDDTRQINSTSIEHLAIEENADSLVNDQIEENVTGGIDCCTNALRTCFKPILSVKRYSRVEVMDCSPICSRNRNCLLIWTEGLSSCCMLPFLIVLVFASIVILGNQMGINGLNPCIRSINATNQSIANFNNSVGDDTVDTYLKDLDTVNTITFFLVFCCWFCFGLGAVFAIARGVMRTLNESETE